MQREPEDVTDMMIQPIVSSMIAAATMTWPTVRRRKPTSRTTIATILTDEIDSAVPRNSVVISRLPGSGSIVVGQQLAQREAAQRTARRCRQIETLKAVRRERRTTDEIGLHSGQQQQQQDAELRHRVDHRLLLGRSPETAPAGTPARGQPSTEGPEQDAGDQLAHDRRLADPLHHLAQ